MFIDKDHQNKPLIGEVIDEELTTWLQKLTVAFGLIIFFN